MSPVLEDTTRRQARARAAAASIIDAPRIARRFGLAEDAPLRSAQRRRVHRSEMPRLVPVSMSALSRRRVAVAVLLVQLVALLAILGLPIFRAKTITVSGNHLVGRSAILAASAISASQSLFTVDGEQVRQRIEKLPWVRSASVETELPSTVRIAITEWTPVLMLQRGTHRLAIADSGDVLDMGTADVAAPPGVASVVDDRPAVLTAQLGGSITLDSTLVRTLVVTAQRFPAAFGVAVDHFEWQADGLFAIVTTAGWRAILGHMLTDQDIAAVPDQLASLLSLKPRLSFTKPTYGYVDLENPAQPAVGGKPGPATAVPAIGGSNPPSPQSSATPAPTPTPVPTPKPTPTPIQFTIGQPSH